MNHNKENLEYTILQYVSTDVFYTASERRGSW